MKRYKVKSTCVIPCIDLYLVQSNNGIKQTKLPDTKKFNIKIGDLVSVLYLERIKDKGIQESIYNGKIKKIYISSHTDKNNTTHYNILLDTSNNFISSEKIIKTYNILDINSYPHEYKFDDENKSVKPSNALYVTEVTTPQTIKFYNEVTTPRTIKFCNEVTTPQTIKFCNNKKKGEPR